MKSGKRAILQKMLNLQYLMINVECTVFDDSPQTSIFCFYPKSTPSKLNNQCKNMRFDFFLNPAFQHSTIPIVSEANYLVLDSMVRLNA